MSRFTQSASTAPAGAHLENPVLHDLCAWRDARVDRVELADWRTTIGEEVDFVFEAGIIGQDHSPDSPGSAPTCRCRSAGKSRPAARPQRPGP